MLSTAYKSDPRALWIVDRFFESMEAQARNEAIAVKTFQEILKAYRKAKSKLAENFQEPLSGSFNNTFKRLQAGLECYKDITEK